MTVWQAVAFVLRHLSLVSLLGDALEKRKVPSSMMRAYIEAAITEHARIELRKELARQKR